MANVKNTFIASIVKSVEITINNNKKFFLLLSWTLTFFVGMQFTLVTLDFNINLDSFNIVSIILPSESSLHAEIRAIDSIIAETKVNQDITQRWINNSKEYTEGDLFPSERLQFIVLEEIIKSGVIRNEYWSTELSTLLNIYKSKNSFLDYLNLRMQNALDNQTEYRHNEMKKFIGTTQNINDHFPAFINGFENYKKSLSK